MSGPVRVLEDGTRVYANGVRYKPVADDERRNKKRRPEDPRAVRWYSEWLILPELVPENFRHMPETVPDSEAYEHWLKKRWCRCEICTRPESKRWKEKADRERGTRTEQP
ncbi:MAG TPA: hypothetical protein PLB21_09630 [Actinomycetota bacterium]|nr:hypothetical protein [Actinomycetota bacterium]